MKRFRMLLFLAGMAALPFFLMAAGRSAPDDAGRLFTDDTGRVIRLKGIPQRIISLSPAVTETLYAIGAGANVAGVTEYCTYPAAALQKPKVGGFSDINPEVVVSLAPDLVMAANLHIARVVPILEKLGIPVVINNPQTITDVIGNIRFIGRVTGREKEADALAAKLEAGFNRITEQTRDKPHPSVFWELSGDLDTAGPGSFINDLINHAGGINLAAGMNVPWARLSAEVVIAGNPDFIFLADHPYGGDLAAVRQRSGWEHLTAVLRKQIVEIEDVDMISRPGPRVIEALEYIARILHPGVFQ